MKKLMIYLKLSSFLAEYGASIVSFSYYPKIFGNIVVTVSFGSSVYEFITDRGDIYCNKQLICDNSYHIPGRSDTVDKLIEVMRRFIAIQ